MNNQMKELHGIAICDRNPPNHLWDFKERDYNKGLIFMSQNEPFVCEEGWLKEDLQEFYGIRWLWS